MIVLKKKLSSRVQYLVTHTYSLRYVKGLASEGQEFGSRRHKLESSVPLLIQAQLIANIHLQQCSNLS